MAAAPAVDAKQGMLVVDYDVGWTMLENGLWWPAMAPRTTASGKTKHDNPGATQSDVYHFGLRALYVPLFDRRIHTASCSRRHGSIFKPWSGPYHDKFKLHQGAKAKTCDLHCRGSLVDAIAEAEDFVARVKVHRQPLQRTKRLLASAMESFGMVELESPPPPVPPTRPSLSPTEKITLSASKIGRC
ncbi:Aste57867_12695 [Aphanomyces stellatus]|uniref:Aste57867_12695 protein n=1 Tax=Aphanomyces stellatus TaxID=120398 RepID=A0A485KWN9_9STRA|nr:hypothetical protein As57867_012648 [Aphanomyces stellatus]VFT89545.1 Aste57867_12695 [Aphanomyces stellatus]